MMRLRSIDFSLMLALKQVRDGESQLQAHHMSQTIKLGGGEVLCGVV